MKHCLVSPFAIFGISMEANPDQRQGRLAIRIGPTGQTESYATLNIMKKTIDGIVGKKTNKHVSQAMHIREESAVLIPNPTYGNLRASQLGRGEIDINLCNEWVARSLERSIYAGRSGRNRSGR